MKHAGDDETVLTSGRRQARLTFVESVHADHLVDEQSEGEVSVEVEHPRVCGPPLGGASIDSTPERLVPRDA